MDKKPFAELVESMPEAGEIAHGERAPAREFTVGEPDVKRIRKASGLSQAKFAKLIHVEVGTLRNWEQGRRTPTGPAQALLRAIEKDPRSVLRAIAGPYRPAGLPQGSINRVGLPSSRRTKANARISAPPTCARTLSCSRAESVRHLICLPASTHASCITGLRTSGWAELRMEPIPCAAPRRR